MYSRERLINRLQGKYDDQEFTDSNKDEETRDELLRNYIETVIEKRQLSPKKNPTIEKITTTPGNTASTLTENVADESLLNNNPQTLEITDPTGKVITVDAELFKLVCRPVEDQQTAVAKLRSLQTSTVENNESDQSASLAEAAVRDRANEWIQRLLRNITQDFCPSRPTPPTSSFNATRSDFGNNSQKFRDLSKMMPCWNLKFTGAKSEDVRELFKRIKSMQKAADLTDSDRVRGFHILLDKGAEALFQVHENEWTTWEVIKQNMIKQYTDQLYTEKKSGRS